MTRSPSRAAASARRARTLFETMAGIGLVVVLAVGVAPAILIGSARQVALAAWIEDLEAGARQADRLGVELREARRVVVSGPGGLRSGAEALLLERADGELVLLKLERRRPDLPGWLTRARFDPQGALLGRERLVALDGLGFRYEQRAAVGVVGVAFDLTLPRRQAGAAPALLSSFALVGAGEPLR